MMIAIETGYPFIHRLERLLTIREFSAWSRWFGERGTTDDRNDLRHGILCALVARGLGSRTALPSDFMLSGIDQGSGGDQPVEVQYAIVNLWASRVNARIGDSDCNNGEM